MKTISYFFEFIANTTIHAPLENNARAIVTFDDNPTFVCQSHIPSHYMTIRA